MGGGGWAGGGAPLILGRLVAETECLPNHRLGKTHQREALVALVLRLVQQRIRGLGLVRYSALINRRLAFTGNIGCHMRPGSPATSECSPPPKILIDRAFSSTTGATS